jgi:Transposase DDE domain
MCRPSSPNCRCTAPCASPLTGQPRPTSKCWWASLVVGRRAVPLYWEAYTTAELKGAQRRLEHAFVDQLIGGVLSGLAHERVLVTAGRGFCTGDFLALLDRWGVGFVLRLTANVTVCRDQQWQQLGSLPLRGTTRRRALGRLWVMRSKPRRYWLAQTRARNKTGRWEYWHLASNRPLSAVTMAQEYARRFSCEEGFRDAKRLLGFADARIADLQAWARMFAVVAAALLVLTQLGTHLLHHPQRPAWLRQVRSRRRARSEVSMVAGVCHLLEHMAPLWELLDPRSPLNLEAAL